jgi:hypothetical protein
MSKYDWDSTGIMNKLQERIDELESQLRWRKYPEEMPAEGQQCICYDGNGYWHDWWSNGEFGIENIVSLWLPIPPIPEGA